MRAPRRPANPGTSGEHGNHCHAVEAALAGDLVCLASGEITTALLLAGGAGYASAVYTAQERGADVVLLIPAGCGALVAKPLRQAATRVIGLHPEVFEARVGAGKSAWRSPRSSAWSAGVAGVR